MQGIESAQRSPTSQAVSATPSLNEVLTFRVMSTHIFGLRIFFSEYFGNTHIFNAYNT